MSGEAGRCPDTLDDCSSASAAGNDSVTTPRPQSVADTGPRLRHCGPTVCHLLTSFGSEFFIALGQIVSSSVYSCQSYLKHYLNTKQYWTFSNSTPLFTMKQFVSYSKMFSHKSSVKWLKIIQWLLSVTAGSTETKKNNLSSTTTTNSQNYTLNSN